jgi:threonine/homoserine/homoserine lactone efflux protein
MLNWDMLSLDTLLLFLTTSLFLAITPGPDNLYVLTQSAIHNRRVGLSITLGLCTGLVLHSLAVAFGLSALIIASPLAFSAVKFAGAAYLAYIGWCTFQADKLPSQSLSQPQLSYGQFYWRGVIMNITNPKIALFFLAFLPQFIDITQSNIALQVMQIGGLFIIVTLVVFSVVIVLSGPIRRWVKQHPEQQILINRLTGVLLVILAIHIAFFSG